MNSTFDQGGLSGVSRLKFFFALSRTPHGLIDLANPALAALLCLGEFPPVRTVILGLITVFAGYTAVYALNDAIDYKTDKAKVKIGGYGDSDGFVDGVLVRHPLAKGILSLKEGVLWVLAWGVLAVAGTFFLNPVCLYIFLAGCFLEIVYCLMLKVSPLRALLNGIVKVCGSVAAVFAVDPSPSILFLTALFLWIFFWEIGGQNIPNDWTDLKEDKHFQAQTIPVSLGLRRAGILITASLLSAFFMNLVLLLASPLVFGPAYFVAVVGINLCLLLLPALRLNETMQRTRAISLFNKASYFPLAVLGLVLLRLMLNP